MESVPPNKLLKSSDRHVREYMEDVENQRQIEWENIGKDFEIVWSDLPTSTNENANGPFTCPG